MAKSHVLVLNNGGLRSLVAAGLVLRDDKHARVALVHVQDGRPSAALRCQRVHQQAEHLGVTKVRTLEMVHLYPQEQGQEMPPPTADPLIVGQLLLAALATAGLMQVQRVVWPGSFDGDVSAVAGATEQMMLAQQFAELGPGTCARMEGPLVELKDRQIVELGDSMGLPWALAWSCVGAREQPCGNCVGCQRRQRAFESAAIVDPQG